MRVAALYDIHGNLDALDAVLQDVETLEPDQVLVGGDVAMGPFPTETLERLLSLRLPVTFIRGNADREPDAEEFVRKYLLDPPSAELVTERFESMARDRALRS